MKRLLSSTGALVAMTTILSACASVRPDASQPSDASASSSASSVLEVTASAEGVLLRAGIGIAMEGTHRLVTEDGQELLLESTVVNLNQYLDRRVLVTGKARATVEAGGHILRVEEIALVDAQVLEETSSSSLPSSSSSSSSSLSVTSPAVSSSSSVRSVARSSTAVSSSVAVSSAASFSSSSAIATDISASVTAMTKAQVDSTNFNQSYCSSHIGFCVPYHRNWYFQSFGANIPPNLWHVEFADHSVEEVGQGVIFVTLESGGIPAGMTEGVVVTRGMLKEDVVVYRQWTGNRHFEISGPKELQAAVEFMANGLVVYEEPQQ